MHPSEDQLHIVYNHIYGQRRWVKDEYGPSFLNSIEPRICLYRTLEHCRFDSQ